LFVTINRIETIAKNNIVKPLKISFSCPAIVITDGNMIKGTINRIKGAAISTNAFFFSLWYSRIIILDRPCHKSNGFLDQNA
jgi:hypothetical protein